MTALLIHVDPEPRPYLGSELRPHFAYETFGLLGDSAVAFIGEAKVGKDTMVDLEDVRQNAFIESYSMLHVICEHFQESLLTTVLRQRYLVHLTRDLIERSSTGRISVRGDDLFYQNRKLTVSIATASPVSGLIHLGINVTGEGAPVAAAGLEEFELDPQAFAGDLLALYRDETVSMNRAVRKVRPVY